MTAKVESQWAGLDGRVDLVVNYDAGGDANVTIAGTYDTHALLAAAITTAVNAVTPASHFICTANATTGRFDMGSDDATFDLDVNNPLKDFLGWESAYTGVLKVVGDDYPPSQCRSLSPLPEPDPDWDLIRTVITSGAGRVVGTLVDVQPVQPIRLRFGPSTGQDWDAARAWLNYALVGIPFQLFRSADTADYALTEGTPNPDGKSLCVITQRSREVARQWMRSEFAVQGMLDFDARIVEGY